MDDMPELLVGGLDGEEPLPPSLELELLARAARTHVRKGQILISEGAHSHEVYYIVSGRVQISVMSLHGRETILRDMGPGRFVGEMAAIDERERSASVLVLEDSVLASMSGAAFRAFLSEVPLAGFWMVTQLVLRVRNLTEKAFELATMPVANRLQNELLRLAIGAGIAGDKARIKPLPTHADLAARIGTHREAVTREMRLLAGEGVIVQSGRSLTVESVSGLQELAKRTSR